MAEPRPRSIPVFMLVRSAFQLLWQQRDDALRLGFVPTLICFAGLLYGHDALIVVAGHIQANRMNELPPGVSFDVLTTLLIVMVSVCLVAANWLRFMLLGPMGAVGLGLNIGSPQVGFTVASLVLGFVGSIAFAVICMPLLMLPGVAAGAGIVVAFVAVAVAASRLLPFLVGLAIAQPISLQQAWTATRGNGVPVALALVLAQVPLWIGATLLTQILFAVGFAGLAPDAMNFISAVFEIATAIVQANVLATAFRHIIGIRV